MNFLDLTGKETDLIFLRMKYISRKASQKNDPNRKIQDLMRKGFNKLEDDKGAGIKNFASDKLKQFKLQIIEDEDEESIDKHIKSIFSKDKIKKLKRNGFNSGKKSSKVDKNEDSGEENKDSFSLGRKCTLGEFRKPVMPVKPRDPSEPGSELALHTEEEKTPFKSSRLIVNNNTEFPARNLGDLGKSPKRYFPT